MKYISITLFLLFFSGSFCSAQTTYITIAEGTNIFSLPNDMVILHDNSTLFLVASGDPNTVINANEIYKVNQYGDILKKVTFVDSTKNNEKYNHIFCIEDTIYTLGWGETNGPDPYFYLLLNKLDMQLNVIDSYEIRVDVPGQNNDFGMMVGQAYYSDSSFILFSSTATYSSVLSPVIVEISKNGELVRAKYDLVSTGHHIPYDYLPWPQGEGYNVFMYDNAIPGEEPGGYIYSYDKSLNIKNITKIPEYFYFYFTALPIDQSNYYLSGTWFDIASWNTPWRAGILEMDAEANVINEFLYDVLSDSASNTAYRSAIDTMSDGNVILCSTNNIIAQQYPQNEPTYINLFKLTPKLDLLWQRYIGGDGKYDAFSMKVTPEDDIVILGAFSETPPVSLYKTDPMFIQVNSDGLFTGINDEHHNLKSTEAILYPSPASDIVNIEFSQLYQTASFYLMDISGKTVMEKQLTANRQSINISSIPAGTYVYRIFNEKGLDERGKVVVE